MHRGAADGITGLAGVRRGQTTVAAVSSPKTPCPLDRVNRECRDSRPNALRAGDVAFVPTRAEVVDVAFVIDACARRIPSWKVSTSATANVVLDAPEQATHARRPGPKDGLVHHSDRETRWLAMNDTWRLAQANLLPPARSSVGDSYDNALAETIGGLHKAEAIGRQRSWPRLSAVDVPSLRPVASFNQHRLIGPIGHTPPDEAEANCHAARATLDMVALPT